MSIYKYSFSFVQSTCENRLAVLWERMTLQNIRLLRNVINESLQVIETAYQAENLDFPSLDKPVYTGITSLNDDPAEALTTSPNVAEAIDLVVSACYQLLNTVRHPFASVADVTCAVSTES